MPEKVTFNIRKTVKAPFPRGPFLEIKNAVLGESYELSLVFVGRALSRNLNRTYRGKDKAANVLSFPLTKISGEIFIDLRQKKSFTPLELFIHGALHLKGMKHGDRMEEAERKLKEKFINGSKHRRRN